jgi:hypothetical protein
MDRERATVHDWQRRVRYLGCGLAVVALGLGSRRYGTYLPAFVGEYAGDTLWALMVFLALGCVAPRARISHRAGIALLVSCSVEISQLYHAPWLDALRHTRLGGLVLGFGFLWSDVVCYAVGVALGAGIEHLVVHHTGSGSRAEGSPSKNAPVS